ADPVRTELLNQISAPGTDWSNASKWCYDNLTGGNMFETIPWIFRLTIAFDYLNAGGYPGFSGTEKTRIVNWLHSAALFFDRALVNNMNGSRYAGIFNAPQDITC